MEIYGYCMPADGINPETGENMFEESPTPSTLPEARSFLDSTVSIFMSDILNSSACINRGVYSRKYVKKLLAEPEKHFTYLRGSKLWHLSLLEYWMQVNVDPY